MMFLLLCTSVFLLSGKAVEALQCHTCSDVARHTGQSSLTCDDFYLRNHTKEHLQGCSSPPSGYTTRCTKFGGQARKQHGAETSFIVDGVSRGCVVFKENSIPQSKCYYGEEVNSWLPSLVPGSEGADVNGLVCFCEESGCNGVGSLQAFVWLVLCTTLSARFSLQ